MIILSRAEHLFRGGIMSRKDNRILVINTGGTIGMQPSDKGLVPACEEFHRQLRMIPELYSDEMPGWDMIDMEPLLDSSNIALKEWNKIGQTIADHYDQYTGFVILHGTDTMSYTASALSFMLENNNKPVILTGSQIPLSMIRTDAKDNLITSILLAADARIHEVCLYFGGKLLRGNRSMKYSSDDLIAFESPNYPALGEAGITIRLREELLLPQRQGRFHLQKLENFPIGVIKVFPGIQFDLFDSIMTEKLKGIVVETFGAGNIPEHTDLLLPIIRKAADQGTIILVCSQCPHGTVSLGTYETSDLLRKAGAVSGYDITTEAAVAKLYYLFSCGLSRIEIKTGMEQDLCGEISG